MTVELISIDPVSGRTASPNVSIPENGLDPRICVQLMTGGPVIARNVRVNLATVSGGTAQGMYPVWKVFVPVLNNVSASVTNAGYRFFFSNF